MSFKKFVFDHESAAMMLLLVLFVTAYPVFSRSPHQPNSATSPNCQNIGQVLGSTNCSPAPGEMNGRFVCREHGAAVRPVCERFGNKVLGGVVYHEGETILPSVGTIRCQRPINNKLTYTYIMITLKGRDLGIIGDPLPSDSSIPELEFGTDTDGWDINTHVGRQPMTRSMMTALGRTQFTPRLLVDGEVIRYFDLRKWTIAGDCERIGCGICRDGENCPNPDSAECIVSSR